MVRAGHVADRLGVSVATVRSWSNEFRDYLSPSAAMAQSATGEGPGQRRYTDQDVAALAHVKRLMAEGLTFDEVRQALGKMTPDERAAPPVEVPTATAPNESTALALPDMLRAITDAHRGEVEALRARIADLQADKTRLQSELDALRVQLAPPALPPPVQPPITPITEAPERPKPWWKLW